MIKVSSLKKYGIELVNGDNFLRNGNYQTSTSEDWIINKHYVTEFAWRDLPYQFKVSCELEVDYIEKKWRPNMQWLLQQESKDEQEDEMISQCNLGKDIASIKEGELHKSPAIPFEPLNRTLTKKDYLIKKAADTLTHTQYMHFMEVVDVMIEKEML